MEWLTAIRQAIDYMEQHLEEEIHVQDVADHVYISPFFLQRGFSLMTGYGLKEYLRNRRLYLAACDLQRTSDKVIDLAFKYGYETPESFTKAFTRFHGASPSQAREGASVHIFLPLTIKLTIEGGSQMDYKITPMFPFQVIGFEKVFTYENAYREIPKFWDDICERYAESVYAGHEPVNASEKAVKDYGIGEYGVCIDDIGEGQFRYLIAGKYTGGEVPEGMVLYEFPQYDWAVFDCIGPMPEALQSVNTMIFKEWLPGNPTYELCGNANIEWYDCNGKKTDSDYHSAIWVPVKKKA